MRLIHVTRRPVDQMLNALKKIMQVLVVVNQVILEILTLDAVPNASQTMIVLWKRLVQIINVLIPVRRHVE